VIGKNDTRPRYVDVVSGRMYLFLCDDPGAHPYLSSLIFTSFVVLTGFMLISLTVAAVSGGVHLRLEQIQKQSQDQDEDEFDDEYLESLSEVGAGEDPQVVAAAEEASKQEIEKEIRRTMRTHTFYGGGGGGQQPLVLQFKPKTAPPSASPERAAGDPVKISRMASFIEEGDSEDEDDEEDEEDSVGQSVEKKSEMAREPSSTNSEVQELQPPLSREVSSSKSTDTDDASAAVVIRPVTLASARLTLANLKRASSEEPTPAAESLNQESQRPLPPTPQLSSQSVAAPDPAPSSPLPLKAATHASRKTFRSNGSLRRNSAVKEELPLLQDKETIRMMLKQMWSDVEKEKEKRLEEEATGGDPSEGEKQSPHGSSPTSGGSGSARESVRRLSISASPSTTPRMNQSTVLPSNAQSFRTQLQRHSSFRQDPDPASLASTKHLAYLLRNLLSTYLYIGCVILIVLVTASVEIFCTNKDNCQNFRPLFVAVQILLTFDILVRVLTYYPSCKTFFFSRHNLFDLGMVLIIWIPIFYSGYGAQIAGDSSPPLPPSPSFSPLSLSESARIVYLLRLLPLLSWITDLQVIMLSIESSIRPLLYVVGLMLLMFFHFSVAGVLIFKRNDEFYFGTLYRAMNALFQICTLDNWGDIALKNMYGCDYYGGDSGVEAVDEMCQTPLGLGEPLPLLCLHDPPSPSFPPC
jgi:hypothetical protein